jgi:UDP-N-acetylenolpyruvoylglucosamine reductase
LIRHVQHEVFRQFGVRLETEVRIVGDACHSQESRRAR